MVFRKECAIIYGQDQLSKSSIIFNKDNNYAFKKTTTKTR